MGGYGSGNHGRGVTTEAVNRIDIRYMRKQGWLKPGYYGTLRWSCGGRPTGSIGYKCRENCLQLNFTSKGNNGESESIEQVIYFDRTPCNYGGERLWFLCPRCSTRVGILYGYGTLFLCRHCYRLPYSTQIKGDMDRIIGQKHALGERIFEDYRNGDGSIKKKGMHQKTFDRLYKRYEALSNTWMFGLSRRLDRMKM